MEERRHYSSAYRKIVIIIVALLVVLAAVAVYFTFFYHLQCQSFECFQNAMQSCNHLNYINEEPEASWGYSITGQSSSLCNVDVTLLQVKKGELGIDQFQGDQMICSYPLGQGTYPEKDLTKCHGLLKEDLQGVVIDKLHAYLIENLGQINQSLNSAY